MKMKINYKVNPMRIMMMIGNQLYDSRKLSDDYFFDDMLKWQNDTYHHYEKMYKSSDKKDKFKALQASVELVVFLIQQIVRFGRVVMSNDKGVIYNFPENEIPSFYIEDALGKKRKNTFMENLARYKNENDKLSR